MDMDLWGKPKRDPRIGDALRSRRPALSSNSDDELSARIVRAAKPGLARLARGRSWWEWTAEWGRVAVPVGLAASLAAGALLVRGTGMTASSMDDTESSVMLGAVAGTEGGLQVGDQLVAQANDSWLLTQALSQ